MSLWFLSLIALVSLFAGATASVVGFGIGSLLTPLIALKFGTDLAIAAIALPHLAGGLLRGWRLRASIDRRLLVRFGILSAAGGLVGALAFARLPSVALSYILGVLLILTAFAGLTRWSERWTPHGAVTWVLGGLSGFFGGVVGNQGGLRAATLSAFGLAPAVFVATSTVIGVVIDLVRTPVYLYRTGADLEALWIPIAIMLAGVIAGTLLGERLLLGLSHERFRVIVSTAVGVLGIWFLVYPA